MQSFREFMTEKFGLPYYDEGLVACLSDYLEARFPPVPESTQSDMGRDSSASQDHARSTGFALVDMLPSGEPSEYMRGFVVGVCRAISSAEPVAVEGSRDAPKDYIEQLSDLEQEMSNARRLGDLPDWIARLRQIISDARGGETA